MSIPRHRVGQIGCILTALTILTTGNTHAMTVVCGERGSSFRSLDDSDGVLGISVSAKDYISWQNLTGSGTLAIDYGAGYQSVSAPGDFVVPTGTSMFNIKVTGNGSLAAVSCTVGVGQAALGGSGEISANSQIVATNTGIGANTKGRLSTGGNIMSKDKLFLATSSMGSDRFLPADWNAWMSLEGRSYAGGISGILFDLVAGVDSLIAPDRA